MKFLKLLLKKIKTKDMELFEEVDELMQSLVGRENHNHNSSVITTLFNLHNKVYLDRPEYSKSCTSCRQRTYNRLKSWWESQGGVKR